MRYNRPTFAFSNAYPNKWVFRSILQLKAAFTKKVLKLQWEFLRLGELIRSSPGAPQQTMARHTIRRRGWRRDHHSDIQTLFMGDDLI